MQLLKHEFTLKFCYVIDERRGGLRSLEEDYKFSSRTEGNVALL
jgi:hypothetical protein